MFQHCDAALDEVVRLDANAFTTFTGAESSNIVLSNLNIRSLNSNFSHMKLELRNLSSNVIALQETWLTDDNAANIQKFSIPDMDLYLNSQSRGKGIATYISSEFNKVKNIKNDVYQISIFASLNRIIFNVYRSSNCCINLICNVIENELKFVDSNLEIFVIGDFNFCFKTASNNSFSKKMANLGFIQLVQKSTHEDGHILDHIYVKNQIQSYKVVHHSIPTLDHDILHVIKSNNEI